MTRHRWPKQGNVISAQKTERECQRGCGIVKVSRRESEGGRDLYWDEFWRGLDRLDGAGTPPCKAASARPATSDARNYPL